MKKLFTALLLCSSIIAAALTGCTSGENDFSRIQYTITNETQAQSDSESTQPSTQTNNGKIKVYDSRLGEIEIDIASGAKLNTLNNNGFSEENGIKIYTENGSRASLSGIDISENCGVIDWKAVKAAGIDFVMVRLGGRGYGAEGSLYSDDMAQEYIKGAQAEGIKAGGYFFSQAVSDDEAVEEANYAVEILGDLKLDFPLAYDWETIEDDEARTDNLSGSQVTSCAKAFCEEVKSKGFTPMIYSESDELYFKYDLAQLMDYKIWLSEYNDLPTMYYKFSMWQYSNTGSVDGISTDVDLNVYFTN